MNMERYLIQALRAGRTRRRNALRGRTAIKTSQRQLTDPTIYFLAPDNPDPSGGARVIYRHIDILNSVGLRAVAMHQKRGFRYSWFKNETAVVDAASASIGPDDLLVVPEPDVDRFVRSGAQCRHVILNQNPFLTWVNDPQTIADHFVSANRPLGIVATSELCADFARFAFAEFQVHAVRLSVDTTIFRPADSEPPACVAFMPRRGSADASAVLRTLERRNLLKDWKIHPIDGVSEEDVASSLRTARIFLSVSPREGLGLPPIEAMASGCYVVGYHGIGGREFMRPEFTSSVDSCDMPGLARTLAAVLETDQKQPGSLRAKGLTAAQFVRNHYAPEREQADVVAAYGQLLMPRDG